MSVRVALPHLGTLYLPAGAYLRALGVEVIVPPFSSRRTLDLGVTNCPEMVCAPCKILFGNYYQGLELGADRLVLFGGPDTCRLGYLGDGRAVESLFGEELESRFLYLVFPEFLYWIRAFIHYNAPAQTISTDHPVDILSSLDIAVNKPLTSAHLL